MDIVSRLVAFLAWCAGLDSPLPPQPQVDTLEPYCSAETLQERLEASGTPPPPTYKAVQKIAARYGAEL